MMAAESACRRRGAAGDRRAPRAGGGDDGACLRPGEEHAGRVHGGVWSRRDEPDHGRRQRLGRLRAAAGHRRFGAAQPARQGRVPGDGPGRVPSSRSPSGPSSARTRGACPSSSTTAVRAGARAAGPGPVYLDLPGDVLYRQVDEDEVVYPDVDRARSAPGRVATRRWSRTRFGCWRGPSDRWSLPAAASCGRTPKPSCSVRRASRRAVLHDAAGPRRGAGRSRALVPGARATAFREADLLLVIGTRINYVIGHLAAAALRPDGAADPGRHRPRARSGTTGQRTSASSATRGAVLRQLAGRRSPAGSTRVVSLAGASIWRRSSRPSTLRPRRR